MATTSLPPGPRKGLLAPQREPRRRLPLEVAMPRCDEKNELVTEYGEVRRHGGKVHLAWNPTDVCEPWNEAALNLQLPTMPSLLAG